ncbi:MAG: lipid II flippase MurJ, partial [Desulforhopalus sp.]
RYPVIASFMAIGINIIIVKTTIDQFGHLAIALSTSCTMLINFIFLVAVLYKSLNGFSLPYLLKGLAKVSLATTALSASLYFTLPFFVEWLDRTVLHQGMSLLLLILLATSIYGLTLHKLQLTELTLFTDKIVQKFRHK